MAQQPHSSPSVLHFEGAATATAAGEAYQMNPQAASQRRRVEEMIGEERRKREAVTNIKDRVRIFPGRFG